MNSYAMTISKLLNLYDVPTYSENSFLEQRLLAEVAQDFISNPENRDVLKTPKGQLLLEKQNKVLNLLEIQRVFMECQEKKDSRRNLYLRILNSAQRIDPVEIDCRENLTKFKSLTDFSRQMQGLAKSIELNNVQKDLHQESFGNIVRSYIFMQRNFDDKLDPKEAVNSLCRSSVHADVCTDEEREKYLRIANDELRKHSDLKAFNHLDAAKELNKKINKINEKIVDIKPRTDQGWFNNFLYDSSDPVYDDRANKAYENYQDTYVEEVTSGIGTLLMSESLKKKVGALKAKNQDEFENSDHDKNKTTYWFEKHPSVKEADIADGLNDALAQMKLQAQKLNRLERKREYEQDRSNDPVHQSTINNPLDGLDSGMIGDIDKRKRDIKRLIKTNPAAVGQLLANHPEYAQSICDLIIDIEDNDESDEFWDETFFWGGIIVGGALMVTGLVAVGGVLVARTLATTALFKTIGSAVTVTGAVVGSVESTYYAKELAQAKLRMAVTEQAFLSGLGDKASIIESKDALQEFNEAKFTLALTLGFTALDLAGLYSILKGARYKSDTLNSPAKEKVMVLNKMTDTINIILGDKELIQEFKTLMKLYGAENISKFISIIGHATKETRGRFFDELKLRGGNNFDDPIKIALRSVRECSQ
ncbi:hypothetical protein HBN50_03325 [Halobacteriovorax sp. GB3]|uniref:hypothetical protein n=1 Tax=Halobacteriovorax sp. GB3 TaxID=2719615 RepID=UPI00235FE670|nr:hypothetical protein [Halobacteriovorax sp. GB3]MDD0852108.1 hypothetical protein [Halobacteriovorax sp. GB3]